MDLGFEFVEEALCGWRGGGAGEGGHFGGCMQWFTGRILGGRGVGRSELGRVSWEEW